MNSFDTRNVLIITVALLIGFAVLAGTITRYELDKLKVMETCLELHEPLECKAGLGD